MDCATIGSCLPSDTLPTTPISGSLTTIVQDFLDRMQPAVPFERRRFRRSPLPLLLQLTPVDNDGRPLTGQQHVVVGRDISPSGLSFFHREPVLCRRARICLDHPEAGRLTVEIDVHRCRFVKLGWYESGARLIRAVELLLPPETQAARRAGSAAVAHLAGPASRRPTVSGSGGGGVPPATGRFAGLSGIN